MPRATTQDTSFQLCASQESLAASLTFTDLAALSQVLMQSQALSVTLGLLTSPGEVKPYYYRPFHSGAPERGPES